MRKNILPLLTLTIILVLSTVIFAQDAQTSPDKKDVGDLTVTIDGFKNDKGDVRVALTNSKENYKSKTKDAFRKEFTPVKNRKAELVFKNIPFGKYAVRLFHDKNRKEKWIRISLECRKKPMGFQITPVGRWDHLTMRRLNLILRKI